MIDEIQLADGFVDLINGFRADSRLDVYITGSNSKFLSSDIVTEFRGRGTEIRVQPLSFSEYLPVSGQCCVPVGTLCSRKLGFDDTV